MNVSYSQKETRELVNLNSCDLLQSQFDLLTDFDTSVALDYIAELSDHLLPPHEPNERFFRLLATSLDFMHTRANGAMWAAAHLLLALGDAPFRLSAGFGKPSDRNLEPSSRDLAQAMLRISILRIFRPHAGIKIRHLICAVFWFAGWKSTRNGASIRRPLLEGL